MATKALDVATIMSALLALDSELGAADWRPVNDEQEKLFAWFEKFRGVLGKVSGLSGQASKSRKVLNAFLAERGFPTTVPPLGKNEIGVVSVLDKLVKWKGGPGKKLEIYAGKKKFPGFSLPEDGAFIYQVKGYENSYLLELLTKSDDTLWLFVHNNNRLSGLEIPELAFDVMSRERLMAVDNSRHGRGSFLEPAFAGAHVPMIDFDFEPELGWLTGAKNSAKAGQEYAIVQAFQRFKMRMDETGARVKVETQMIMFTCAVSRTRPFVVDRPFYGWWTTKGLENLPLAAFFADYDCWKRPAGTLAEL